MASTPGRALLIPIAHLAGSTLPGDDAFQKIFHFSAVPPLEKCDAAPRVGGASAGAGGSLAELPAP